MTAHAPPREATRKPMRHGQLKQAKRQQCSLFRPAPNVMANVVILDAPPKFILQLVLKFAHAKTLLDHQILACLESWALSHKPKSLNPKALNPEGPPY